jgi:hypothetical protein
MAIAQIVIGAALLLAAAAYWTWHLANELPWTFWFMSPLLLLGGGGVATLLWHPVSHWLEDMIFEWRGHTPEHPDLDHTPDGDAHGADLD